MAIKVIDNATIAAAGTFVSEAFFTKRFNGYQSLQVQVSGNGAAKFYYKISNNGSDFLIPYGGTNILTGVSSTSGPGSDGKMIVEFICQFGDEVKICCEETGGVNSITVSAWLTMGGKI